MKRILIALAVAFGAFAACTNKKGTTAKIEGLDFDSIVVDTTVALTNDKDAPRCNVTLSLQFAKGNNADKINNALIHAGIMMPDYLGLTNQKFGMKQAVDSFMKRLISDYVADYGMLYRQDREHATAYNYDYKVKTATRNGAKNIIVYTAKIYTYGGGAHGINQTLVRNIDVATGNVLQLQDVFVPGYEPTLKELLLKKVGERFDANGLDELNKKDIFADGYVYVPDNFSIDDDSFTFTYCEDEIAPHAVGEISVTLSRSELSRILK